MWEPPCEMSKIFHKRLAERPDFKGEFRVILIAKFEEAVYVLHAFQKKTQKIPKKDLDIAKARYEHVVKERKRV